MTSKRKRENTDNSPGSKTTANGDSGGRGSLPRTRPGLEIVATRKDPGKEEDSRPKKKKKDYVPCQPPTITTGQSTMKLSIEWTVEQRTIWEGETRRQIATVRSPFAEQVIGFKPEENPHWSETIPTPPAASILKCSMPITQAPFPDVCFSSVTIFGNVRKEVAEELKAHSESYMALIPFGAGNKIFEQARVLTTATADLVSALANDGTQYSVAAPVQEDAPPHKAWFARPFAMILKDPSPSLRKTLLDTKTVAYRRNGENFAFLSSNIPLSENSWIVCNFKGGPVMNRPEKMTEALTAISRQICQLNGLRSLANRILSKEGVGQSSEERIHVAIAGLSLIYIDRRDEEDREDPVWQLHGKPLTKLDKEHREWLRAVRHVSFFIDSTTELIQERARVGCVWCKSELHTNLNCPLPRVKDWLGPQPPKERLTPEPRDTSSSKEGKRATRKERKGKGKARD